MNREIFIAGLKENPGYSDKQRENIIKKSIQNCHWKTKCTVAMEELAELQQEISKKIRGSKDKVGLLEEMADVYICLEFLKSIFNIHESDVFRAIDVKLEREEALQKGLEKKNREAGNE